MTSASEGPATTPARPMRVLGPLPNTRTNPRRHRGQRCRRGHTREVHVLAQHHPIVHPLRTHARRGFAALAAALALSALGATGRGPGGQRPAAEHRDDRQPVPGLMAECDVRQVAPSRWAGLDSRARAESTLPLRSCGYGEEQRPAVTAMACRPLAPNVADQVPSWPVPAIRARIGRKARKN